MRVLPLMNVQSSQSKVFSTKAWIPKNWKENVIDAEKTTEKKSLLVAGV